MSAVMLRFSEQIGIRGKQILFLILYLFFTQAATQAASEGLTRSNIAALSRFLTAYVRQMGTNDVSLCMNTGVGDPLSYRRLFTHQLLRRGVYVNPCFSGDAFGGVADPCLQSGEGTPSIKSRGCAPVPWPIQVFVTDVEGMADAQDNADAAYHVNWGAVQQLTLGVGVFPKLKARPKGAAESPTVVLTASYDAVKNEFNLIEAYRLRHAVVPVIETIGIWRPAEGFLLTRYFRTGPGNFQGQIVAITVLEWAPLIFTDPNGLEEFGKVDKFRVGKGPDYYGLEVEVVDLLAEQLNFTYTIELPPELVYGAGYADGCLGLLGQLCQRKKDMLMGGAILSEPRLEVADFLRNIEMYTKNLYYRSSADVDGINWSTYFASFHSNVWFSIAGLMLISTAIFTLIMNREGLHDTIKEMECRNMTDVLFMHFQSLVQQGCPTTPSSTNLRFVSIVFGFYSVILFISYGAKLTANLTVAVVSTPFSTLEEAAKDGNWQVGWLKNSIAEVQIKSMKEPWAMKMMQTIKSNPYLEVYNDNEAVQKILASNFVYIGDDFTMDFAIQGFCSVETVKTRMFPAGGGFYSEKNIPYGTAINNQVAKFHSTGILKKITKRWKDRNVVVCSKTNSFKVLGLQQTMTVFILLAISIVIAFCILAYERTKRRGNVID